MCVWTKNVMVAVLLISSAVLVQAEETKKKKHLVDLADGMDQQAFYATKNPDAIFSSDGSAPWAKSDAVNAWEQEAPKSGALNAWEAQNDGLSRPEVPVENLQTGEVRQPVQQLLQNGKPVDIGTLINIRVRYTVDPEHSKAAFSPVSAPGELYRQMGSMCGNGFQKLSEWSKPIEGADYYLFYQFRCMDPEQQQ